MGEWNECVLGTHIEVINGFAFKSKDFMEEKSEGSMPVIKIKNVANGDVRLDGALFHQFEERFSKFIIRKGDILVALTGNHPQAISQVVGATSRYKLDFPALLNQRVANLRPLNTINADFLYFLMKEDSTFYYLSNQSSGSANQANISKGDIENIPISLPPLPEQKAIASVLSSLDDKIDLLHRQNKTLEDMAETLFRQWFVEEAQDDWEEASLSSIANFLNGLACQKFPADNDIDRVPVLKIKELRNGISENSDWATSEVKPEYIVSNGDIIFSWSASLMVKIWDGVPCVLNQHLFKVTSDNNPKWFYYQWCKFYLREFINISASHATTMGHIKRKDLEDAMVLVPSEKEMLEMTAIMTPMINKTINNNTQIRILEKLRDTLLPKLMSGEVRVEYEH